MSEYDPTQVLTQPGRLYLNPTTVGMQALNRAANFGGSAVGYKTGAAWEVEEETTPVWSEARARRTALVVGRTSWSVAFTMIQYDPSILQQVYAYTGTGLSSVFSQPDVGASLQPGLRAQGPVLLFAPDDLTQPGLLILAATYTNGPRKKLLLSMDHPREEAIVGVVCEDPSTGLTYRVGPLTALSLT